MTTWFDYEEYKKTATPWITPIKKAWSYMTTPSADAKPWDPNSSFSGQAQSFLYRNIADPFLQATVGQRGIVPYAVGNYTDRFDTGFGSLANKLNVVSKKAQSPPKRATPISDDGSFAANEARRHEGLRPGPDTSALRAQLERNLDQLKKARDKAVRRAGSGAAAPYNAAIARINQEIAKLEVAQGQTRELFAGIQSRIGAHYQTGLEQAQAVGPETQAALAMERGQTMDRYNQAMESHIKEFRGQLATVGLDEKAMDIATAGMQELSDQIMTDSQSMSIQRENVSMAAQKLAEATIKASRAKDAADIGRQQVVVELDIQGKLDNLIQQRNEAAAARSAAVSAARQQAADAFGDIQLPLGDHNYAMALVRQHAFNQFASTGRSSYARDEILQVFEQVAPSGMIRSYTSARNLVTGMVAANAESGRPALPQSEITFLSRMLWDMQVAYTEGMNIYKNEIIGSNPEGFAPWSLDRANSLYAGMVTTNPLTTFSDALDVVKNPAYHQNYTASQGTAVTSAPKRGGGSKVTRRVQ